jgi:hypothetical protein
MHLRDHPLMTRKSGIRTWPPLWSSIHLSTPNKPTGEIGTLKQVLTNELMDTKIFLFIDYNGLRYMGLLAFDDPKFCTAIHTLLNSHIDLSIKEIGDLDVSFTL